MKFLMIAGLTGLVGCSSSALTIREDAIVSHEASCDVSYPQLPRCECGCAGDICTTGSMGVVVCDIDQSRVQSILFPARSSSLVR